MKKIITLVFALVLLSACNDSQEILGTTSEIAGNLIIDAPQTQGTSESHDVSVNQDLSLIIPNFNRISSINVNRLSFLYGNVTGNANAVIEEGIIVVNGVTITTINNVNVTTAANGETVFSIVDGNILSQLGTQLLANGFIVIDFIGSILSDEDPVNFSVVVSLNITATI